MYLAVCFGVLAVLFLAPHPDAPGPVRLWLGLASLELAVLYTLAQQPERSIGRWMLSRTPFARVTRVLLTPYRWGTWIFLYAKELLRPENHLDEIVPGLYLGRRPLARDRAVNAPLALAGVVDLCCEFAPSGVVVGVPDEDYLPLPALDGTAPALADTSSAVDWIERRLAQNRKVLVHCAAGHGRSATIVACLLIRRRLATDAETAIRLMRAARPLVSLNRTQRALVARYAQSLTSNEPLQDPEDHR